MHLKRLKFIYLYLMVANLIKACRLLRAASFCCFISLYSFAQQSNTKHVSKEYSTIENKILEKVLKLPEVKKRSQYVEAVSKGQRHLGAVVYQTPTKESNFYWVKVWEDNDGSSVSHFNFFVNAQTLEIKYFDTINDTLLDLKTWRQRRQ